MEISVIHKTEHKPKQANYLGAIGIGALSGYALKYILPITKQERDERYFSELKNIRKRAREEKMALFQIFKNSKQKKPEVDAFIKIIEDKDDKKTLFSKIKKLEKPMQKEILNILSLVNEKSKFIKMNGKKELNAVTKAIRPGGTFAISGAITGVILALGYNITQRLSFEKANKY